MSDFIVTNVASQNIVVSGVMQGKQGIQGEQGDPGIKGDTGPGVAAGGTSGQVLSKVSSTDYDSTWSDPAVSSVNSKTGVITLTTSDVADSTDKRYVTDADLTLLGNTSGVNTGDQTSVTGNAGTATKLATARNINGVAFDGSANITVADSTKVPTTTTVNGHALSSNVTVSKSDVGLGNVTNDAQLKAADLDTDGTLAANSDSKIASQKATKTYTDTGLALKENVANKDTTVTLGTSDTKYPSQKAVKTYADFASAVLTPGLDSAKPLATSVKPGAIYFSTDIYGGTQYTSDGSSWLKSSPSVKDASGTDIQTFRLGTDTTGVTKTVNTTDPANVLSDLATNFVFPSDGRNVRAECVIDYAFGATMPMSLNVLIQASKDNSNWTIVGKGSNGFAVTGSVYASATLPAIRFNGSMASPYNLTAGDTVYLRTIAFLTPLTVARGSAIADSTAYNYGDIINNSADKKLYFCKLAYTSGSPATSPASDTTHWTAGTVTLMGGYNAILGVGNLGYNITAH